MATGRNFTGQRFGFLVAVRRATKAEVPRSKNRQASWLLKCDCGQERFGRARHLLIGKLKACGINGHHWRVRAEKENPYTKNIAYRSWTAMKDRCSNPKSHNFNRYGGFGVGVCERWRDSFAVFLEDMGPRPSLKHSIDRWPDPAGNYEPGNCRWATDAEQRANQRRSVYVEVGGERILLNDYAKSVGLAYQTIYGRLRAGWTLEEAVTIPVGSGYGRK